MKNDYVLITPRGKTHKRKFARVFTKEEVTRAFKRGYDFIICEKTIELDSVDIVGADNSISKSVSITIHSNKPIPLNCIQGNISLGDDPIVINGSSFLKDNEVI